jgi:hypothetical protein
MRSSPARQRAVCICVHCLQLLKTLCCCRVREREREKGEIQKERDGGGTESALRRYCRGFIQFISSLDVRTNIERDFFLFGIEKGGGGEEEV